MHCACVVLGLEWFLLRHIVATFVSPNTLSYNPYSFCKRCYDAMQRKLKAVSQHRHFNSRMELYKWEAHTSDDECKVRSNAGCSSNVNLHNLYSNPRFVTILGLNIMVEDHTRLKRP